MKRIKIVSCLLIMCLLIISPSSIFAKDFEKLPSYDLLTIEKELIGTLNASIKEGNSNIDNQIEAFFNSKDSDKLHSMFLKIKDESTNSYREYILMNGSKLKFYNDGTFDISKSESKKDSFPLLFQENKPSNSNELYARSRNWDTGSYTESGTHYGWFGVKLFTVSTRGRFTFNNGVLKAYSYGGDVKKHFAGGFFNQKSKKSGRLVTSPNSYSKRGEFYTKAELSLGLKIKGIGYEKDTIARCYAYNIVNKSTGYFTDGWNLVIR